MTEETQQEAVAVVRRRGRWCSVSLVLAVLLLVTLAALWLARKPIAADFIDRELARRGVPARYQVKAIGLRTQRLEGVSIGDARAPDLTADWIEVDLVPTFGTPEVREVRAGGVRLRGRLQNGQLALGVIDRLLPASSGGPFRLPDLRVDLKDARLALAMPAGAVEFRIDGRGNLASGFSGIYAATAPVLAFGDCRLSDVRLDGGIATRGQRPHLTGPLAARDLTCPNARVSGPQGTIDATLEPGLIGWRGIAKFAGDAAKASGWAASGLRGQIDFAGNRARTSGAAQLTAFDVKGAPGVMPRAELGGRYAVEVRADRLADRPETETALRFDGTLSARGASLAAVPRLAALAGNVAGTPVGPLAAAVARFAESARRASDLHASLSIATAGEGGTLRIGSAELTSAGGALRFSGGEGARLVWPGKPGLQIDGRLTTDGAGLPRIVADLRQAMPGAPISGVARMDPFVAGGARVALTPVRFAGGRFATVIEMSGPLGQARIDHATLPLSGRIAANGRFSGLIEAPRLDGRLGESPISVAAQRARLDGRDFGVTALAVRLGKQGEQATRLDVASLTGTTDLTGRFAGTSGRIANVPLLLTDASGAWRWSKAGLGLSGDLRLSDAAAPARFNPLVSHDAVLKLAGDRLSAQASLLEPDSGTRVLTAVLRHDLGHGSGSADLDVAGLRFDRALQPEKLTPLTLGVIADVRATLSGKGRIAWTGEGVTSTGDFHVEAPALAAPFGPVTGLSGDIRFTDLLGLVTAPGQIAHLVTVNPGILVENGEVRYRLLPGMQVALESARWPFAGGELTLRPTTLDFSQEAARHLTFDIAGLDAEKFVNQLEYKNLAATGAFDGTLPMIFDRDGGRIEGGQLVSRAPGGTLSYVGEVSNADLGIWGGIAFDALKAIRYQNMTIGMNGRIDGEMVSEIRFHGVSRGTIKPVATGLIARVGGQLATQLQRLPFIFNIRIRAPFRGLLSTARSFYDPSLLINDRLGPGFEAQQPIQPPESETKR